MRLLTFLAFAYLVAIPGWLCAQETSAWRISPEKVNIQMGEDRALQLLDGSAQELHGASWSVDNPDLAELTEENGYMVLHPKGVGLIRVTAMLGEQTQSEEIKIWSSLRPLPTGTTRYSIHPIGREIGDIPAVPGDGPTMFSVEQTAEGKTYLRAGRVDGIQLWTWLMPETANNVELVCGDWMGGALLSANHSDHFTLYTVGKDGKLRWQHTFSGIRKGHAYNLQHLVHILSQSEEGTNTVLTGLDEVSGSVMFELKLPASHEFHKNAKRDGSKILCGPDPSVNDLRTLVSHLFVNMDGNAYVAFTKNDWTLEGTNCVPGSIIDPHNLNLTRDEHLLLWEVHPDGTYRSIDVETTKIKQLLSAPINMASPSGALLTDNMNGTLIPVRLSHTQLPENVEDMQDMFIYRVSQDGELLYRLPLPKYPGPVRDEIVIGSDELAFATRGGVLIAFNVTDGKELWRWDSKTDDISVVAALADGSCLVQTPTDAVDVASSTESKVFVHGHVLLSWDGHVYLKHN